jgi:hypothetical protein
MRFMFGETIDGVTADGRQLRSAVFNENEVRAAAGLTMALGAVAFAYAALAKEFVPIKLVTAFFFVEFFIRVTIGLRYSPIGVVARLLTRRQRPEWVSAKPKRFAWTLGAVMSGSMMVITNSNITGPLPKIICVICLTLMWMESVLGVCLGCELHALLVRHGRATKDAAFEVCAHGACDFVPGGAQNLNNTPQPLSAATPITLSSGSVN